MMDRNRTTRIHNAFLGAFIGDALAMPVHWYYSRANIREGFDGGVTGYESPPHPHPESFMVGMAYRPDVDSAERLGRRYDILHEHARFYETNYTASTIRLTDREGEHGNAVPSIDERYHYHHGLSRGENTLGAQLLRVLLRSIAEEGRYRPEAFLEGFVYHLTEPGLNRDPYTEIYIRRWFERYTSGVPLDSCAENQRVVWSIGSHGGMIRPMALGLLTASSVYQATGVALEHQVLTHRSQNVASALAVAVPLLDELVSGADPTVAVPHHARSIRLPAVTGSGLFAAYREHEGPGNIPVDEMWRLHTDLRNEPFDVAAMARDTPEEQAVMGVFATACYPEHGLPLSLYLAMHHRFDLRETLLANANAGGDNVHRGMVLGLIVGASTDRIPHDLVDGLAAADEIQTEVAAAIATLT